MSDLALDPVSGDLLLEQGCARLAEDETAVKQLWATHLTLFSGECFLDRNKGIDFQRDVLGKGVRPAVLRTIFAEASRNTPGVLEVRALRFSLDSNRVLTVQAEVVLDDGSDQTLSTSEQIGG